MASPQLQTGFSPGALSPPPTGTPMDSPLWANWFSELYDALLSNGSTFPKISLQSPNKIRTITTEQLDQDNVVSVNCGWYSNYTTDAGTISYGMASNVRRSSGNALVVGGQFTGYANQGVNTIIFGGNMAAVGEAGSNSSLVGLEVNAATKESHSTSAKIGIDYTFINYGAPQGLGGNFYNAHAYAMRINSTSRSSAGEFCGWNIGMEFQPSGLDQSAVPAWSSTITYQLGDIVSSGGLLWKCIVIHSNQVPPNASFWVQRSVATGYGTNNYAVGIDMSGLTATDLSRIWSAIRLQSLLPIHWDSAGTIATYYDGPNNRHVLSSTFSGGIPVRYLQIDSSNGTIWYGGPLVLPGGGGGATLSTVGGSGPTVAAQAGWLQMIDNTSTPFFIPVWR